MKLHVSIPVKAFVHPTALLAMHWWAITHLRKKAPVKTASPLGKGAAAKQQDEACAADWKIIFFPGSGSV